ncbi:MAG: hypothetical protein MAG431_01569 [Chloroflexi bacterium]|nr:hypothetical protein [Chloroflexota bacterium]
MKTIKAQVIDNTLLKLSHPIPLPKLSKVMITILPLEGDERDVWLQASADWLNYAYGDDEPEYTPNMIKEPNPEFEL